MKIILATDFSASSVTARTLLSNLTLSPDTLIEVVHVLRPQRSGLLGAMRTPDEKTVSAAKREVKTFARELAARVVAVGGLVHGSTIVGDPATRLVERARETGSDLVVLGGGRGDRKRSSGSVCAAVVDGAPCSVLVARTPSITHLLLADDGSASADAAADLVASWPIFDSARVTVLNVVDMRAPPPRTRYEVPGEFDVVVESIRERAAAVVARRADELSSTGRVAVGEVREGDPAAELLGAARAQQVDVIVLGTSRKTGLSRMLLGSVARSVLKGTDASVVIARATSVVGAALRRNGSRDRLFSAQPARPT